MGQFTRTIRMAIDKNSGVVCDANELFQNRQDNFQKRKNYNENKLEYTCYECGQDLVISNSRNNNIHFKHKKEHDYCILSEPNISQEEFDKINEILIAKESYRHKELKNKIGERLKQVEGVDIESIQIDNKFIFRDNEKRKPDVYCKYQGKELVFEIQLSELSLRYILNRYNFYKKNGIYLIWILYKFDIHNQERLEKDIKYLAKHQNFFKLDEESKAFKLKCDYKMPFLTNNNELHTKWKKKSVTLGELKFDSEDYQAYYFNLADEKVKVIISNFKKSYGQNLDTFKLIVDFINDLDEYEVDLLNKSMDLKGKNKCLLIHRVNEADLRKIDFLNLILITRRIELDLSITYNGRTILQAIFENNNIVKYNLTKSLFQAGYKLTESDNLLLSQLMEENKIDKIDYCIYQIFDSITDKSLISTLFFNYQKPLCIMESIMKREMVYFKYSGNNKWLSFANNAIEYHKEYWEYFRRALKYSELWKEIQGFDNSGVFKRKNKQFDSNKPKQNHDLDDVFNDLYPELRDGDSLVNK